MSTLREDDAHVEKRYELRPGPLGRWEVIRLADGASVCRGTLEGCQSWLRASGSWSEFDVLDSFDFE